MQCAKSAIRWLRKTTRFRCWKRTCSHAVAVNEQEVPQYEEIIDLSNKGRRRHERQLFYNRVEKLPTIEQKLLALTESKNVKHRTYAVSSCPASYSGTMFHRYVTRTHVVQGLPERIESMNVDEDYAALKPQLEQAILKYLGNFWKLPEPERPFDIIPEHERGSKLVNELITHIFTNLAWKNTHLLRASYDPRPALSSFWWHGGFANESNPMMILNLSFQFRDHPYYTVRIDQPLPPIVSMDDPLCATSEVVEYNYHPKVFGIPYKSNHISCLPGFWPGSPCDFPLFQVYTLDYLEKLTNFLDHFTLKPIEESFLAMASFGWLNGLAAYQGFSPYHDLTYPIVGQTIITNGQDWIFSVYQLNTITFNNDLDKKDRRNLCWCSERMRLFETSENGELKGLNDDVLKTLIKFAVHSPAAVDQAVLKPYLGEDTRTEEEAVEMREQLVKYFANIPSHDYFKDEVPMWQRVYKLHKDAPPCPWIRLE